MSIESGFNFTSTLFFALSVATLRYAVFNLIKCGKLSYAIDRNIKIKLNFCGKFKTCLKVLWYSLWFNNKEQEQLIKPTTTFMLSVPLRKRGNNKTVATNSKYFDSTITAGDNVLFSMKSIAWGNASMFFALLSLTCKVVEMISKAVHG